MKCNASNQAAILGSKYNISIQVTHDDNEDSKLSGSLALILAMSYMGQRTTLSNYTKGHICEAYLFLSELSDVDRIALRDNINGHFEVY